MALFDLLGKRWAMGIVWQLRSGPATFRALQGVCESISPAVLNSRLKELREARLVVRTSEGYGLTDLGMELSLMLEPFGAWALKWAMDVAPEDAARWLELLERKRLSAEPSPDASEK
jgi:DNA-binding HxlR family transcriptional regulator